MNIEFLLLAHVIFGVFGTILGAAVGFESYLTQKYSQRKFIMSIACTVFMFAAMILGGFWYLNYYPEGKELIKAGSLPWAHAIIMESKEHIFFLLMIAALILPFSVLDQKRRDGKGSGIIVALGLIIFVLGMMMEGMGGLISLAVRISLGAEA